MQELTEDAVCYHFAKSKMKTADEGIPANERDVPALYELRAGSRIRDKYVGGKTAAHGEKIQAVNKTLEALAKRDTTSERRCLLGEKKY